MLRLLLIAIWVLIIMVLLGIPALLVLALIGLFNRELEHRLAQRYVLLIVGGITFLAGEKIVPLGLENIPENEGVLFISNHRSLFDIFTTYRFFKGPTACISKLEWKYVPILKQWMDTIRCIYLDRSSVRAGLKATAKAEDLLKKNVSVWVCPEGTRNHKDELLPFHEGSFRSAFQTGRRIVPFTLTHTDDLFEKHKPWIRPATVTVSFGKPIETAGLSKEQRKALIADIARDIQCQYNELQ
ncbi:MAG: 1-acyl-sn-glycerol-3-phosphate acyltransferase [Lachnospiraceae bacterium]|jgi:1-acyl-sn-glycerol-3-phosphate acyltransferase|nr:1-acyl-sn-glycerol-3-phosphate acyltransferase [Lachnospiraceae bacterium]